MWEGGTTWRQERKGIIVFCFSFSVCLSDMSHAPDLCWCCYHRFHCRTFYSNTTCISCFKINDLLNGWVIIPHYCISFFVELFWVYNPHFTNNNLQKQYRSLSFQWHIFFWYSAQQWNAAVWVLYMKSCMIWIKLCMTLWNRYSKVAIVTNIVRSVYWKFILKQFIDKTRRAQQPQDETTFKFTRSRLLF